MSGQYYYQQPVRKKSGAGVIIIIIIIILLLMSALAGVLYFVVKSRADTSTDTPADTPTDTSAETPTDTPADTSADIPTDTPADTTAETPTDTPADTTAETPTDTSADTPTDTLADPKNYWILPGYNYTSAEAIAKCKQYNSKLARDSTVGANNIPGNNFWVWSVDDKGNYKRCREYNGKLNCDKSNDLLAKSQAGCEGPYPSTKICEYSTESDCHVTPSTTVKPGGYWILPGYNYTTAEAIDKCDEYNSRLARTSTVGTNNIPSNNLWVWSVDDDGNYKRCREYNGKLDCTTSSDLSVKSQAACEGPYPSITACKYSTDSGCYITPKTVVAPSGYWVLPGYRYTSEEAISKCKEYNSTLARTSTVGANDILGNNLWVWSVDDDGKYKRCREYNGKLNCTTSTASSKAQAGCEGPYPSIKRCSHNTREANCYIDPKRTPTPPVEPPVTSDPNGPKIAGTASV